MKKSLAHTITIPLIGLSLLATSESALGDDKTSGIYVKFGTLQTFVDEEGLDDNSTGGELYLGYHFNQYFAIEAGYHDFTDFKDSANTLSSDGYGIAIIAAYPVTSELSLSARFGMHSWDASGTGTTVSKLKGSSGENSFYGIGMQYQLNENWSAKLEYANYKLDEIDLGVATLSAIVRF